MKRKVNWTTQRRVIYDLILSTDNHPTANDIIDMLRASGYTFAYGTVYNSLRYLVEIGMLREVKLRDSVSRYDARTEEHMHVICDRCGKISETMIPVPDAWIDKIEAETNYRLLNPDILFHGICSDCQSIGDAST